MGSLRNLKRGGSQSETGSDKALLFTRLQELVAEHGKTWGEIASIIEEEGFRAGEEVITANALRKGYTRWTEAERAASPALARPSQLGALEPAPPPVPPVGSWQDVILRDLDKTRREMVLLRQRLEKVEPALSVTSPSVEIGESITGAMEEFVATNKQLLAQIEESNRLMQRLEKRLEEQESKTSHTEHTDEQPVSLRDLLELLRELGAGRLPMMHIEEERKDYLSREEVQEMLEETVQEQIDAELRIMLSDEGSTARDLSCLIDRRLKSLFSGGEPVVKTAHAGPGRGRKGKTHKKFSASLEESLFERVKSLPGQFSRHLSNALEAYLAVMEKETED